MQHSYATIFGCKYMSRFTYGTIALITPPLLFSLSRPKKVVGYTQQYWGRDGVARDGVTSRDRLIEVDFREGAQSVFDDPRYVGRKVPTGEGADIS